MIRTRRVREACMVSTAFVNILEVTLHVVFASASDVGSLAAWDRTDQGGFSVMSMSMVSSELRPVLNSLLQMLQESDLR